jgi:hypothetical protein
MILCSLLSCKDDNQKARDEVYISGTLSQAGYNDVRAVYWKDGTSHVLNENAIANAIFVTSNGDIYVAGSIAGEGKYWRNDQETSLDGKPNAIIVSSNGDVHITGNGFTSPDTPEPTYWKNGTKTPLTDSKINASTSGLFVTENEDVYIAGNYDNKAIYWKNQEIVHLTDSTSSASAVFVVNSDIFVAGSILKANRYRAAYWKNNVLISVLDTVATSNSSSIYVTKNEDVYLAGWYVQGDTLQKACIWKNGVRMVLQVPIESSSAFSSRANAIKLTDAGDIYVSGNITGHAAYWKNGVRLILNDDGEVHGSDAEGLTVRHMK